MKSEVLHTVCRGVIVVARHQGKFEIDHSWE